MHMYVCVWVCVCMFRKPKTKKNSEILHFTWQKENFLSITKNQKNQKKKKQHPPIKNTLFPLQPTFQQSNQLSLGETRSLV